MECTYNFNGKEYSLQGITNKIYFESLKSYNITKTNKKGINVTYRTDSSSKEDIETINFLFKPENKESEGTAFIPLEELDLEIVDDLDFYDGTEEFSISKLKFSEENPDLIIAEVKITTPEGSFIDSFKMQYKEQVNIENNKAKGDLFTKVISGGQTGIDTLGLQVAKNLGIETGGTAPRGFLRETGIDSENLSDYGVEEISEELENAHREKRRKLKKSINPYTARTEQNVINSDGTVYFSTPADNLGLLATKGFAKEHNKPFLENPTAEELIDWAIKNNIKILNVAGNRGSTSQDINSSTKEILEKAFRYKHKEQSKTENNTIEAIKEDNTDKEKKIFIKKNLLNPLKKQNEESLKLTSLGGVFPKEPSKYFVQNIDGQKVLNYHARNSKLIQIYIDRIKLEDGTYNEKVWQKVISPNGEFTALDILEIKYLNQNFQKIFGFEKTVAEFNKLEVDYNPLLNKDYIKILELIRESNKKNFNVENSFTGPNTPFELFEIINYLYFGESQSESLKKNLTHNSVKESNIFLLKLVENNYNFDKTIDEVLRSDIENNKKNKDSSFSPISLDNFKGKTPTEIGHTTLVELRDFLERSKIAIEREIDELSTINPDESLIPENSKKYISKKNEESIQNLQKELENTIDDLNKVEIYLSEYDNSIYLKEVKNKGLLVLKELSESNSNTERGVLKDLRDVLKKKHNGIIMTFNKETNNIVFTHKVQDANLSSSSVKIRNLKEAIEKTEKGSKVIDSKHFIEDKSQKEFYLILDINGLFQPYKDRIINKAKEDKSYSPVSFADEILNTKDEGLWNDGDIEIDTQSTSDKRPRSDNFVEMINFYSKQIETLKRLSSSLNNKLNSNLKSKELAEKKADIDSRISKYTGLVNDLRRGNNFHKIFHAIKSDLDDINQALDQNIIIEGMREKLDFFHMLLKGAGYINKDVLYDVESIEAYNPDSFNKFNRYLDDIALKYQNKLREIAKARINEDIAYANNLGDKLSEDELDDLLSNRDDINYLELQTLGITESMNSETIIPQIIKSVLETAMVENESIIKDKKHRLINAAKNLKSKDFTWIFEKTKFGNSTGNLMSLYTHEFYEALEDYKRIKLYTENPQERIYKEIEWLRSNVEVIDVTKLSWVKDIYGDEYSIYFTHSDEDMEAYDNQLKSILGSQYESEKKKILDKLSLFKLKADAISSSNTPNADLEILRQSPFEFSRNYYSSNIQTTINIINDNGQTVSTDIDLSLDNFSFIPKTETVESLKADGSAVMKDSGYYNKNFESILSDPAKKEYYEAIVDLYSNFINPIYGKDQLDSLSYGKMEEELMEIISTAKGFDKVTGAYARMKSVAKSMISDPDHNNTSNGVKSNYTDSFEHQRRELAKVLTLKPLNELKQMAKENGLTNVTQESKRIIVRELSYKLADQGFSKDLTSLTVALADLASQHQARQDALPIIENLAEMHYSVKKEDGGIRTNSNKKLQNYIDVIVKNDPVKDGKDKLHEQAIVKSLSGVMEDLPYTKGKGGIKKVYSDTDKIIKEELEKLQAEGHKPGETTFTMDGKIYQSKYSVKNKKFFYTITSTDPKTGDRFESVLEEKDFEEAFQAYIKYKLDHLGVPMTMGSVVTGIQKILILKGMALNPFSGIINRVEGRDTNFRMDATGLYWTPGNMEYANNFLALSNLTKLSNKLVDPPIEKMKQIELFVKLMHEFNVIQDRKSELDKNISNSNYSIEGWLNVYAPAIDHPEFKNQGEIVLSILMDTKIKDVNGEEHPFFNKDTMTFTAYELVEGNLKLKDEFNTEDNQKTWGSFGVDRDNIENNGYLLARSKMKHAIARSQGNYESNDTQMILNSTLGRVVSQYKRWLPEHVMQRFNTNDKDYDLQTGKKKQKGRYIHVLDNAGALGGLGLFNLALGVGATPFMAAIGVGLTASAIGLHLYRKYSGKAVKTQANQVMVFADFMRSIAFSFLNYPLRVLHLPSKWRLNHQIKTGYTQLTEDEARQLSAAAVEMSHKLTYMIITMIGTALLWDDEDDEKKARARFFINQSQKLSNSANMYLDPKAFMEDSTRVSFFQWINDIYKVSKAIAGEDEFEAKQVGKLFMPRIVADIAFDGTVVQDKKEFTPGAIEVAIGKNYATDGNYTAKKKIEKVRSKYREEVTKELESTLEGEALEKAVETRVKEKYPPKKKGQTYKEYLENLETQDSEK